MSELEKKTLAELKTMAAEMGVSPVSGLKKSELIEKIEAKQLSMEQKEEPKVTASDFSQTKSDEIPQVQTEKQIYEETGEGILEVLPDGYGFLRAENCLPGINDVYVSPAQIRRFNLRTGDRVKGIIRPPREGEKVGGLIYVQTVNGDAPYLAARRPNFEDLTPIYPDEKLKLETEKGELSGRIIDLIAPIGKGQRGMIVALVVR